MMSGAEGMGFVAERGIIWDANFPKHLSGNLVSV